MAIQNKLHGIFIATALSLTSSAALAQTVQSVTVECRSTSLKACDDAIDAAKNYTDQYLAYANRARAYLYADKYSAGLADVNMLLKINPSRALREDPSQPMSDKALTLLAEAYVLRARMFLGLRDYAHADEDMKFIQGADPRLLSHIDNSLYYNALGQIDEGLGRTKEAIADYSKVVASKLTPTSSANIVNSYRSLGVIARTEGRYQDSLDNINRAIAMAPEATALYFSRGRTYHDMEKWNEAVKDFDTFLQADNDLKDGNVIPAYGLRADSNFTLGNYDKTIADTNILIASGLVDPKDDLPNFYLLRAEAYSGKKESAKAIQDYTQSIKLRPDDNEEAYVNRSKEYLTLKQYDEALADLDQAIKQDSASPPLYLLRGSIYADLAVSESKNAETFLIAGSHARKAGADIDEFVNKTKGTPNPELFKQAAAVREAIKPILPPPLGPAAPTLEWIKPLNVPLFMPGH